MRTALITGADRGLGLALTKRFASQGWHVFASSYLVDWPELKEVAAAHAPQITIVPLDIASDASVAAARERVVAIAPRLDLLVNNAAVSSAVKDRTIHEKQDYSELMRLYDVNTLGALRVVDAFLPLVAPSDMKRLCFVSSEAGSISRCERESWYGYCMSKTALNMGVKHLFHTLRPQGYTFRLFHPGWMRTYMSGVKNTEGELEADDVAAAALAYFTRQRGRDASGRDDEDRLVMRDWRGREWPW